MEKLVIIYWETTVQGLNSGLPVVEPRQYVWSSGKLQAFILQQAERTEQILRAAYGAGAKIRLSYTNIQVFDNDLKP